MEVKERMRCEFELVCMCTYLCVLPAVEKKGEECDPSSKVGAVARNAHTCQIREFAHAWARCAFGGRIAHFQALFVHNSTYLVAECSTFYYHHIFNILSMIII